MTAEEENLKIEGFCELMAPRTLRYNRPGLSEISYRLDSHTGFLRRMLAKIHRQRGGDGGASPPLRGFTTRSLDDPAVAILDGWAMVGDVLTFYQERIANEGFLRTATEKRSVMEMARAIGYELKPGVAASTLMVFMVEKSPATPELVDVPLGTKVRSIPAPGKLPQTFETIEDIKARAAWNELAPKLTVTQEIGIGTTELYLEGFDTRLEAGDGILLVGDEREARGAEGSERWDFRILDAVETVPEKNYTRVTWQKGLGSDRPPSLPASKPRVFAFRQRAALFGHNAPDGRAVRDLISVAYMSDYGPENVEAWPNFLIESAHESGSIYLDAVYPKVLEGSWIVLMEPNYVELYRADQVASDSRSDFTLNSKTTRIVPDTIENLGRFYKNRRRTVVFAQSEGLKLAEAPRIGVLEGGEIELDRSVYGLEKGKILVVSGKRMRAIVKGKDLKLRAVDGAKKDLFYEDVLQVLKVEAFWVLEKDGLAGSITTAFGSIIFSLDHKRARIMEADLRLIAEDGKERRLDRGDLLKVLDHKVRWKLEDGAGYVGSAESSHGQILLEPSMKEDPVISEAVTLNEINHAGGRTTLVFQEPLVNQYDPSTVILYANVARATHGEGLEEVLGSGDGAEINQRFELQKPPLTYTSAPTSKGIESTLEVRVNGVLWQEVSSFYGLDGRTQCYIVRIDEESNATVIFGDGERGARLSTGDENITASYRSGIGLDGEVSARSLTLLQTRPPGISGVFNPLPASGGAPPEKLSEARRNAPLTVLTLDRIVSLRDLENFARSFAGIGKAQAELIPAGEGRMMIITIGSTTGSEISPGSELYKNLCGAIEAMRDPVQRVQKPVKVESYSLETFSIEAALLIDASHLLEDVLSEVEETLREAFSFDNRDFGQPVTAAEVLKFVQKVSGVVAADLERLERDDAPREGPSPTTILEAKMARLEGGVILGAELLLLNPAPRGVVLKGGRI